MKPWQSNMLLASLLATSIPSTANAAQATKLPGKQYFRTADGCGFLIDDATLSASDESTRLILLAPMKAHWIGECRHGLVDGVGYWYDPTHQGIGNDLTEAVYLLGEDPFMATRFTNPTYSVNLPNQRNNAFTAEPGSVVYAITDLSSRSDELSPIQTAGFPVIWSERLRTQPVFNVNDGSEGDDVEFQYSGPLSNGESYEMPLLGMRFEAAARSCDEVKIKIKGCVPPGKVFDVYGVVIDGLKNGSEVTLDERFIPCPDPRTSQGCETIWQQSVGGYLDAMLAHARLVSEKTGEQNAMLAQRRKTTEAALPNTWRAHWAANPPDRGAVSASLSCREVTDYGPVSLQDAQYIQRKYSTPPCNISTVASPVLERVGDYINLEQETTSRWAQQIADLEKYNRDRAVARSEAWAGFFNSMNAMLTIHAQNEQQRIANENARAQARAQAAAAATPAYQSYGQPASSTPQTYAPDKVQTRAIHKPELDAGHCVKLVQLSNGDPLSSYGSQVFSNQCGQTVEVFWCKIGDECERGSGGSWTIGAGSSYPVSSGTYRYGACLGKNSGGFIRDGSGVHTGRYSCTGP